MAFPWNAVITGGAGLLGQAFNFLSGKKTNEDQIRYNNEMFEKQKARDLEFFNMQNDYNNPSAQMARFSAAGLNPNLVYGTGAVTQSATPHASNAQSYNPTVPKMDLGAVASQTMDAYFDTQIKQAQVDNLRAQNTDIMNGALLKSAQTMATLESGESTKFKTEFAKETAHITRAFMAEQANKMHYDQFQSQSAATVADEKNQLTLETMKQNIRNMKSSEERNKADVVLKKIETTLRETGVNPNDPMWMRMIIQILSSKGISVPAMLK